MNLILGWSLITLGLLSGAALGIGFLREDFLGGYGDPRRRLLRLAHIALIALGGMNALFHFTLAQSAIATGPGQLASIGLAAGALSMPVACVLVAWRRGLFLLFTVPVVCLAGGAAMTAWGLLQ